MTRADDTEWHFPRGFRLGAATSAHQVEGGNRHSDWWEYEQDGRLPYKSGDACDHYRRYEADFDIAQSLGHDSHRLSVEWARLEPAEGDWDQSAAEHYASVFDALLSRGIEPIVTLNHFTLPAWFLQQGGWLREDAPERFAEYVRRFVADAGDRVKFWLTINEPTVYVQQAYLNGEWPPLKNSSWRDAGRVLRNLARAHRLAYQAIKEQQPHAQIGFAHSALDVQACDPGNRLHRFFARIRDYLLNARFFRLLRSGDVDADGNQHNLDFIGINYFTQTRV